MPSSSGEGRAHTGRVTLACAPVEQVLADAGWRAGQGAGPAPHWLSADEVRRLGGLTAPQRAQAFVAGRWLLRQACARHSGRSAGDWSADAPPDGPPVLRCRGRAPVPPLHLSLSHSGRLVACAVADAPVGLDIEDRSLTRDVARLAPRVLDAEEQAWLAAQPDARAAFLSLWTLKEAAIKRQGSRLGLRRLPRIACRPGVADGAGACPAWVWQTPQAVLALAGEVGEVGETAAWQQVGLDGDGRAQPPQRWSVGFDG